MLVSNGVVVASRAIFNSKPIFVFAEGVLAWCVDIGLLVENCDVLIYCDVVAWNDDVLPSCSDSASRSRPELYHLVLLGDWYVNELLKRFSSSQSLPDFPPTLFYFPHLYCTLLHFYYHPLVLLISIYNAIPLQMQPYLPWVWAGLEPETSWTAAPRLNTHG